MIDNNTPKNLWFGLTEKQKELYRWYFLKSTSIIKIFFTIWSCAGIFAVIMLIYTQIQDIIKNPQDMFGSSITCILGVVLIYFAMIKLPLYLKNISANREIAALDKGLVKMCVVCVNGKERHIGRYARNEHSTRHDYYVKVFVPDISGVSGEEAIVSLGKDQFNKIEPGDDAILICYDDSMRTEYMFAAAADWFEQIAAYKRGEWNDISSER